MNKNDLGGTLIKILNLELQKEVTKKIEEEKLKHLTEQLETFSKNLEIFAIENKDDIQINII